MLTYKEAGLTKKEIEIVELMCKGNITIPALMREARIAKQTVKMHITNIAKKANINKRYKIKSIIKKFTGKTFIRYRTKNKSLQDTSTGGSLSLYDISDISRYLVFDEYNNDVTSVIAEKIQAKIPTKGYHCDCNDLEVMLPTEILPGFFCANCGSSAFYKE